MLSNPTTTTTNLHPRQRQHRRQNSTPTAFEAVKMPNHLPNIQQRQPVSHRRGMSLDTRSTQQQQRQRQIRRQQSTSPQTPTRQEFTTVSITTNPGLSTTPQHVLREAQQQRLVRPGQGQPYANAAENFLISPQGTPQFQHRFDTACFDRVPGGQHQQQQQQQQDCMSMPYNMYSGPVNVMMKKNHAGFSNEVAGPQDFELFPSESTLSSPTFVTFPDASPNSQGWISEGDTSGSRRNSRRISNGIMSRVSKFETMGMEGPQRPITPPNQNGNCYFPPTPMETPHDRMVKQETRMARFTEGYDESMEETLKPVRRSPNRASNIFLEMRKQAEAEEMRVAARVSNAQMPMGAQDFVNMNNISAEFLRVNGAFDGMPNVSVGDTFTMSPATTHPSNPTTPEMHIGAGGFDNRIAMRNVDYEQSSAVSPHSQSSPMDSGRSSQQSSGLHRRTDSVASIVSAASISSINIEETKTDTGVTGEEIAQYIEGPDTSDGKWLCKYEDCGKKFGRKENIKSHVQTHLNDRQYQCPTCNKCFVRQHDLKRHAKIHTGIKPYPCECGNSFARHDALTRHRQRGMCIGAFDGIVRKVVKRGRPKKHRPDMDTRLEKSARTRNKIRAAGGSPSASSQSGYSDSSAVASPNSIYDNVLGESPFDDMMDVAMTGPESSSSSAATITMNPVSLAVSSAPMPGLGLAAVDLGEALSLSPEHINSPSNMSHYSHVSQLSFAGEDPLLDGLPSHPHSPAKSVASHFSHHPGTPPELSASSSPPPSSATTRYFEFDPNTSCGSGEDSLGLSAPLMSACGAGSGGDIGNVSGISLDEDLLKAFTNEDGMVSLDTSGMMLSSKFEDEYGMYTNNDDVFFGTS